MNTKKSVALKKHTDNKGIKIERIISELIVALDNSGEKLLAEILKKINFIPNDQVLKMLLEFNINYQPHAKELEDDAPKPLKRIVTIGDDCMLEIRFLLSVRKLNEYDHQENKPQYRLVINEDPTDHAMYSNTKIDFASREQRDLEWATLRRKLEAFNISFI